MQKKRDSSQTEGLAERIANTAVGEHLARKIKYGDSDTGWRGDPFLVLTYEESDGGGLWRIWDTKTEPPQLVCQKKADGSELNTRALTARLREADLTTQTAQEIIARMERSNKAVDAAVDKATQEKSIEIADGLAEAISYNYDKL